MVDVDMWWGVRVYVMIPHECVKISDNFQRKFQEISEKFPDESDH